jgi:hypothetical protein
MRPSDDRHDRQATAHNRQKTVRLVAVPEATEILGVTPDAVRSRLRRGKLRKDRDEDGTVLVALEVENDDGRDRQADHSDRQATGQPTLALVEALQDQIDHLRKELDEAHQANRENRRLLAAALERIPEIEAPQEASGEQRESPVTSSEVSGNGGVKGNAEQSKERRSWLYRFFFGP